MPIPNLLGGIIMVVIAWNRCNFDVNFWNIALFLLFVFTGAILTYAIFLLPRLLAFWVVSTNGISQVSDSLWDFNNMPMGIYNRVIQGIGCFLLPVFLITNVPGLVVGGRVNPWFIGWSLAAPFLFLAIAVFVWRIAIRKYSSASS